MNQMNQIIIEGTVESMLTGSLILKNTKNKETTYIRIIGNVVANIIDQGLAVNNCIRVVGYLQQKLVPSNFEEYHAVDIVADTIQILNDR